LTVRSIFKDFGVKYSVRFWNPVQNSVTRLYLRP